MTRILLDANMLIAPFQVDVNVFTELERLFEKPEIYTLDRCLAEAGQAEDGKYKQVVERLVETQDITVLGTDTGEDVHVDTVLAEYAAEGFVVATNDRELRQTLNEDGRTVVYIRSSSHLTTNKQGF